MRILVEEINIKERNDNLLELKEYRKQHPRTLDIRPDQVSFLEDFAILAKSKEATRRQIIKAFDEITTVILAGEREGIFLGLSQAFAILMEPIPFSELPRYRAPLIRILDELYAKA